jgi:hypothetical protein
VADISQAVKQFTIKWYTYAYESVHGIYISEPAWAWGGSMAGWLAIVHFGSVGRLWGLFERSKAT